MFSILWSSEHKTAYVAYEKQKIREADSLHIYRA